MTRDSPSKGLRSRQASRGVMLELWGYLVYRIVWVSEKWPFSPHSIKLALGLRFVFILGSYLWTMYTYACPVEHRSVSAVIKQVESHEKGAKGALILAVVH